ncbi:hypothetical protein [Nesterenkonia pannonica]|uniref:hypothetical protein n=1 Tax=Nesterenkonia pannonica TaxID=1548602 RepID=UPI002164D1F7|nr:hypothetical protein [Nesterenkonia pannonica]
MTTTDRMERVREKAEEHVSRHYEDLSHHARTAGRSFVAGADAYRTLTDLEWVVAQEEAAEASYMSTGSALPWALASKPAKQEFRRRADAAMRALGFLREGSDGVSSAEARLWKSCVMSLIGKCAGALRAASEENSAS